MRRYTGKKRDVRRWAALDNLRGLTLLSMIAYHACWDMVYLFGADWDWYASAAAYVWQQSICWTFILLSGFCWPLGSKPLRRGLEVFGGGLAVTAATLLFMPANRVVFGVLTLLGSCMLLMIPLERFLARLPAWAGLGGSALLFWFLRDVNRGLLGRVGLSTYLAVLPGWPYRNLFTAFLGFPPGGFLLHGLLLPGALVLPVPHGVFRKPPVAGPPADSHGRPPHPVAGNPGAVLPAGVPAAPAGGIRTAVGPDAAEPYISDLNTAAACQKCLLTSRRRFFASTPPAKDRPCSFTVFLRICAFTFGRGMVQ